MTIPDFEIKASLRARELVGHVPPDARTETKGEAVALTREESRAGLPSERMESGRRYHDVTIEKRVVGTRATTRS